MNPLGHSIDVLASACTGLGGCHTMGQGTQFWSTSVGGLLGTAMSAVGWIFVIALLVRQAFQHLRYGGVPGAKWRPAWYSAILLMAILLIYPGLLGDVIGLFHTLVGDAIHTLNELGGHSSPPASSSSSPPHAVG